MMELALREAEAALAAGEVPVGCVFVHPSDGIIARGHNRTVVSCNATRHAELEAIDQLFLAGGAPAVLAECTLYVTVEPCVMCASALRQLRLRSVVFGCANDKFGGCGAARRLARSPITSSSFSPPTPAHARARAHTLHLSPTSHTPSGRNCAVHPCPCAWRSSSASHGWCS